MEAKIMRPAEQVATGLAALSDGIQRLLAESWTPETIQQVEDLLKKYHAADLPKLMERLKRIEDRLDKVEDATGHNLKAMPELKEQKPWWRFW